MVAEEGSWQWPRRSHSGGHRGGQGELKVVAMEVGKEKSQWKPRRVGVVAVEVAKEGSLWWLRKGGGAGRGGGRRGVTVVAEKESRWWLWR